MTARITAMRAFVPAMNARIVVPSRVLDIDGALSVTRSALIAMHRPF